MSEAPTNSAAAPETLEGWYALHQIFSIDRRALASSLDPRDPEARRGVESTSGAPAPHEGWSICVELIGSAADVMVIHFRPTLDEIGQAQRTLARSPISGFLSRKYTFLSVTEAGLYHLSAELAKTATARGGSVGDAAYREEAARRVEAGRSNPHVQRRLFPAIPDGMDYVCFYPMSKRRTVGQNWYALSLDERSRLMHTHGTTGRRYAGRVMQIITGAIGLDAWEWGVTLFGKDPIDFKKLVTDMRFDEVSAHYAEFGDFYVGRIARGSDLSSVVETIAFGRP
jgi:chlorite dismutase